MAKVREIVWLGRKDDDPEGLEGLVNEFINEQPHREVIDVKFSGGKWGFVDVFVVIGGR